MNKVIALLFSVFGLQAAAQNVGIGTASPVNKLDVIGTVRITDSLGIGVTKPLAPLQFANTVANRKLVLFDGSGGGAEDFYGFGVNHNQLRYQSQGDHVFYSALSPTASREVLRLNADGRVGIGTGSPASQLANTAVNIAGADGRGVNAASFTWAVSDAGYAHAVHNGSTGDEANGMAVKIAGSSPAARILDLSAGAGQASPGTSVMVVQGDGRVGIGNHNPAYKLDVGGNARVAGDFIHTTANLGGTKVHLTNIHAITTDWKMVAAPSPTPTTGGQLLFLNANNSSVLTLEQNRTAIFPGNLVVGGEVFAGVQRVAVNGVLPATAYAVYACACPANTSVMSGGGGAADVAGGSDVTVNFTGPEASGTGWRVAVTNRGSASRTIIVWAICTRIR